MVRETCSWQDYVFSASAASMAKGCCRFLKISGSINARVNMEWILSLVWFPGICFRVVVGHGAARSSVDRYGV